MQKLVIAAALACAAFTTQAQEIKGIKLGMTKAEVQALYPNGTSNEAGFTIAGVLATYSATESVQYENDKVVSLYYHFNPGEFKTVRDAFKAKYPELNCVQHSGKSMDITVCKYKHLHITDIFGAKTQVSTVSLSDDAVLIEKANAKKRKAAADL